MNTGYLSGVCMCVCAYVYGYKGMTYIHCCRNLLKGLQLGSNSRNLGLLLLSLPSIYCLGMNWKGNLANQSYFFFILTKNNNIEENYKKKKNKEKQQIHSKQTTMCWVRCWKRVRYNKKEMPSQLILKSKTLTGSHMY